MSIIYDALKKLEKHKSEGSVSSHQASDLGLIKSRKSIFSGGKKVFVGLAMVLAIFLSILLSIAVLDYVRQRKVPSFSIINKGNNTLQVKEAAGFTDYLSRKVSSYQKDSGKYILEGVVYDSDSPFAIINGQQVKKNEMIDKFRVIEINRDSVELLNTEDNTKSVISLNF